MSRIFLDGFESGDADLWDTVAANASVISSAGKDMDGDYCLDLTTSTAYVEKTITADDEMYFAFLWRPGAIAAAQPIILFYNGANYLSSLFRNTSDKLYIYRGTTIIATGTQNVLDDTTYLIEVRFKIADAGGRFVVKVDGVTDIDFTGDTKEGAYTQFDEVRLGYYASIYYALAYFDNLIMDDASWIGDTKIQKILPTGAGNSTNWTPSVGNNYACVDERPASDADYVSVNSNDVVDTYVAGDMSGSVGSVKCVQIQSRTESEGAPTPTNLQLVARSGGTDYFSSSKVVPASPKGLYHLWPTDPADSLAWTENDVNNLQIGIKSIA